MSKHGQQFVAPEVQGMLEEVAKDPRSVLLRVPKLTVPGKYEPPVRDREAFLTRAERELVRVHRFEVADLLHQEVRRVVIEGEEARGSLLKHVSLTEVTEPTDPIQWESNARRRLVSTLPEVRKTPAFSLLEQCVMTVPDERPSAVELATAALRLVPRAATKICLGLALDQEDQTQRGLDVLKDVVESEPSAMMESFAWQNIGGLAGNLGRRTEELEARRSAALGLQGRGDTAMAWFLTALELGDQSEALRASDVVRETVPVGHESIDSFVQCRIAWLKREGRSPCDVLRRTSKIISNKLSEQAWQIAHALSN